jgi:hypothetical protein
VRLTNKFLNLKHLLLQPDFQIFEEQFMYGHRELLLTYSGLAQSNQENCKLLLEAGLQHGWLPDAGIFQARGKDLRIKPRFVWNNRWEINYPKMHANVSIGAPWLYLIKDNLLNFRKQIKKNKDSVLVFPSHSVLGIPRDIKSLVLKFDKLTSSYKRKLVCLYWVDFVNPEVYSEFSKYGFEMYCAGFGNPRGKSPFSDDAGRSTYLINLLEIFLNFSVIISDQIQSGVFYALSIGMKLQYVPIENSQSQESSLFVNNEIEGFHSTTEGWIQNFAPEFLKTANQPREFQELALNELGMESVLSKSQVMGLPWKMSKIPTEPILNYMRKNNYLNFKSGYNSN